jgi:hypothetical protein
MQGRDAGIGRKCGKNVDKVRGEWQSDGRSREEQRLASC